MRHFISILIITCFFALLYFRTNASNKNSKVYYDGEYTFISLNLTDNILNIYQKDLTPHPILRDSVFRGSFRLAHILKNFYSLEASNSRKNYLSESSISIKKNGNNFLKIKFIFPILSENFNILAFDLAQDTILRFKYHKNLEIELPVTEAGYKFSLMATYNPIEFAPSFAYQFNNTVKFVNLPCVNSISSKDGGEVEINIPFLTDDTFRNWCVIGEIIQFSDKGIIWNGHKFNEFNYENKLY